MNVQEEIAIKLGLKAGDLKAALADTNSTIKSFAHDGEEGFEGLTESVHGVHQAVRTFHQFLVAGGIFTFLKEFYTMGIEYAKKHKDAQDEDTEALLHFQEGIESSKESIGKFAVVTFGFLDKVTVGWEALAAGIYSVFSGQSFQDGINGLKIAIESERNIAEIAKQHAEDVKKVAEMQNEIAAASKETEKSEFERLSTDQKIESLSAILLADYEKLAVAQEGSIGQAKIKLEIIQGQKELGKALAEQQKEEDEREQNWLDYKDTHREIVENEKDRAYIEAKKKADALLATTQAQTQATLDVASAWSKANLGIADAVNYAQQMLGASKSMIDQWENFSSTITKVGGSITTLSDVQLQALIQKLQIQVSDAKNAAFTSGHPEYLDFNPLYANGVQSLNAAQAESDLRRRFAQTIGVFGQTAAEQQFAPADFARLMQLLNPDQAKAQASDISTLTTTITNLFPTAAAGARKV